MSDGLTEALDALNARIGKRVCFHAIGFPGEGLPVEFTALTRNRYFRWRGIYGLQVGRWFFGVVRGGPGSRWEPSLPAGRSALALEERDDG